MLSLFTSSSRLSASCFSVIVLFFQCDLSVSEHGNDAAATVIAHAHRRRAAGHRASVRLGQDKDFPNVLVLM